MGNYTAEEKKERERDEEKIECCWKNKRNVSAYIILRYMYKSGYTRKDREGKGTRASISS
jgi:hypothetical protein